MSDEKRIIIDEDWKSQVEAERQEIEQGPAATSTKGVPGHVGDVDDPPMPPATFELLLTTLAMEALVALGQMPHPATGQAATLRNQARYLIDTIDVLKQKTKGNLTPVEQQMIDSLLHQLQMVFIATANATVDDATTPPANLQE
jgi:hypothetical protein